MSSRNRTSREKSRRFHQAMFESLEARDLLAVAPAELLVYYGYPSSINATYAPSLSALEFARYPFVVLGGGLELSTHPDHASTRQIINDTATNGTKFFGYVDLGVSHETSNFSLSEINARVDGWKSLGADGIFLDDFGYDFGVTRARQNAAVDYVHSVGLPVVANGWVVDDVLGAVIDPVANPTGDATKLAATDYYFFESQQISEGSYVDAAAWRAKADRLAAYRSASPIGVLAVTTTKSAIGFNQAQFDYAWWSSALEGFDGFGWGEPDFASVTAQVPVRAKPAIPANAVFNGSVKSETPLFTRETTAGRIVVDTLTHTGGLSPLDFGDAPDGATGVGVGNYRTTMADDGARHVVGGPRLGSTVDFESDSIQTAIGWGDNAWGARDENGVEFTSLLRASASIAISASVVVNVQNSPAGGYLDGWIDFNGDGDWLDAGEAIFVRRAVAAGDNLLAFQVPAGATSGLTYARFRLSSAGGLGPTGLASDGEVEDHAVMIGGASGLTAVESALEAYRFGNGQPRSSLGPAFYDTQGRAWYFAETYFTGLGLQALLAAPDQTAPNNFDAVQRHLSFFLNRIEADGTVRIWLLDASGNPPSQDITIKVRNPQTRQDEWRTLLKDKASLDPDADDSALASIISLAAAYQFFGGESRADATPLLGAAGVKAKLELLADTMLSLRELNGLTRVYLTPQFAGQPVAVYLMDNLEVRTALYAIARLEREFYNDAATAAKYQAAAAALDASIATHFYDAASGTYRVLADGPVADLDVWYADSLAQIWTVTEGWLPATSPSGQTLLTKVFDRWDGSPGADWTKRGDGGAWAWVALQAGQVAKASESLVSLLPAILRNDAAYVGPIAAPDLKNGQEVPTTIADVGFALQTLLPAATNDQVSTGYEKSVDFDPRGNDFSISSRTSDLSIAIIAPPASGSLTVLADGALRYTPNEGFSGDDRLRYKVTASDGGSRAADVSIHVNHRPQLANAATISYRRGEGVKAIDSSVVVTDADNAKLASAVVSLNPFTAGVDELRFTANSSTMGNISVVSNSNGVLRLASSGVSASTTQWQNALRSVGYFNGGATTSAGRQATFVVNDGIDDSPPLVSTINVDTQPPTVAIEFADSRLSDARRSTAVTFRFSEAVTGFTSADVTSNAGALSSFALVNASTYTATFTSNDATEGNGSVAVTGAFTDIAGNTGVGGLASIPIDTRNPTVSLSFGASSLFDGRISTSVTIQFSEPIVGFAQDDLSAGGDSLSNFAAVDADTYTATFTARDGIETTGSLQVVGEYSDLAGNIGANGSTNIAIDTLNPTVSLQFADLLLYDGRRSSIVTIQFSEAVAGFVLADLSAGGDALSSFVAVDADTYRVTFTARDGVDATGTVQLSGAYTDIAGNVGVDGSARVAIDTLNPTLSLQFADTLLFDGRRATQATLQFSEPVVDFNSSYLSAGGDGLSDFVAVDSDTYTVVFTARDGVKTTGILQVSGAYSDTSGNVGAGGVTSIAIDTLNPTVDLRFADSLLSDGLRASQVTIQFSEAVAGFTLDDLSTGGDSLSDFTAVDADTYRVAFTARDGVETTGSIQLVGAYTDVAGNVGGGRSANIAIDTLNPTVDLQFADALLYDEHRASQVTIQFSEAVSGFSLEDLSAGGDSLSDFTAVDADTYRVTFTAREGVETTGSIQLVGAYTDLAGNAGGGGSATIAIETLNPTVELQFADSLLYDGHRASQVTVQFSEAIAGFSVEDLSAGGDSLSDFTAVDADTYRVTFTARDGVETTGSIQLVGAYTDLAGNTGARGAASIAIDTRRWATNLSTAVVLPGQPTIASWLISADARGSLDAWLDFNRDGDWTDWDEQVAVSRAVPGGRSVVSFSVPAGISGGIVPARLKLTAQGGLQPESPPTEGQFQDFVFRISDGAQVPDVAVVSPFGELNMAAVESSPGVFSCVITGPTADGTQGAASGLTTYFSAPVDSLGVWNISGNASNERWRIDNLSAVAQSGRLRLDALQGDDRLTFLGSGYVLNFTSPTAVWLHGFEMLDMRGDGRNQLALSPAAAAQIAETGRELVVAMDADDVIDLPGPWTLGGFRVEDGQFLRLLDSAAQRLALDGPRNHQNPLAPMQVIPGMEIAPVDVLMIVNEINSPRFSDSVGRVYDPATLVNFDGLYRDVNGDGYISPIDALEIINYLNARTAA